MASAAERNTVWVGFMDTVPVIGTVKEVVEWVLALYEGNKVVVLEKEKAIFQLVREPLDERMKRLALMEKPEDTGAAASKSALLDIQEVKQDELLDFLSYAKESQKEPSKIPKKEKPSEIPEEEKLSEIPEEKRSEIPEEEKPSKIQEEKPSKIPEEEKPSKIQEEEKPSKIQEEEKPSKIQEEEKPSKIPEEKPSKIQEEKPSKIQEEEKPSKIQEEEKPSKIQEEKRSKIQEEEKPSKIQEEEKFSKIPEEEKPSEIPEDKPSKIQKKRKNAKIPEKEKAEKEKKLQKLTEDILRKIHLVNPNYSLVEPLKEELRRSRRGEHVFNNNILMFHSKVLEDYITENCTSNYCVYRNQQIAALGTHTLSSDTEDEIQTNMVVHFDEKEFYVNANAILYGVYCNELRTTFHDILHCRNPVSIPDQFQEKLENIIYNMNNNEIYVDEFAKVKWINNNRVKREKFDHVKGKVVDMYRNKYGWDWIIFVIVIISKDRRRFML